MSMKESKFVLKVFVNVAFLLTLPSHTRKSGHHQPLSLVAFFTTNPRSCYKILQP